jgi:hypothetical protein
MREIPRSRAPVRRVVSQATCRGRRRLNVAGAGSSAARKPEIWTRTSEPDFQRGVENQRIINHELYADIELQQDPCSELSAGGNEFIAILQRRPEERRQMGRFADPTGTSQVPQYFLPGSLVPTSAIYKVFHGPRCSEGRKKEAFWCGDTFPIYRCRGPEVRYRFYSRFD